MDTYPGGSNLDKCTSGVSILVENKLPVVERKLICRLLQ